MTLLVWATTFFLWSTGEKWPGSWIASYQLRSNALWSAGITSDEIAYKAALYDLVRPQIVVIGSSRSLQFRAEMFNRRFLNMARGIALDVALPAHYRELTRVHKPKTVIWGVDYWMFAESRCRQSSDYKEKADRLAGTQPENGAGLEIAPRNLFELWTTLLAKKFSVADLLEATLLGGAYFGPRIGLRASLSNRGGYIDDGSYLYLSEHARPITVQKKLQDDLERLAETKSIYSIARHEKLCGSMVSAFRRTLDIMRKDQTNVVLIFPPLPQSYTSLLTRDIAFAGYYEVIRDLVAREAQRRKLIFINGFDLNGLNFPDVEFLDSIHPGETIMAKLLLELATRHDFDGSLLKEQALEQIIKTCRGMATCGDYYGRFGVTRLEPPEG